MWCMRIIYQKLHLCFVNDDHNLTPLGSGLRLGGAGKKWMRAHSWRALVYDRPFWNTYPPDGLSREVTGTTPVRNNNSSGKEHKGSLETGRLRYHFVCHHTLWQFWWMTSLVVYWATATHSQKTLSAEFSKDSHQTQYIAVVPLGDDPRTTTVICNAVLMHGPVLGLPIPIWKQSMPSNHSYNFQAWRIFYSIGFKCRIPLPLLQTYDDWYHFALSYILHMSPWSSVGPHLSICSQGFLAVPVLPASPPKHSTRCYTIINWVNSYSRSIQVGGILPCMRSNPIPASCSPLVSWMVWIDVFIL